MPPGRASAFTLWASQFIICWASVSSANNVAGAATIRISPHILGRRSAPRRIFTAGSCSTPFMISPDRVWSISCPELMFDHTSNRRWHMRIRPIRALGHSSCNWRYPRAIRTVWSDRLPRTEGQFPRDWSRDRARSFWKSQSGLADCLFFYASTLQPQHACCAHPLLAVSNHPLNATAWGGRVGGDGGDTRT
jgi:hypothetical protein